MSEEEGDEDDDGLGKTQALARIRFAGGSTISYYRDGRFEAVCRCRTALATAAGEAVRHTPLGRCRLTRTAKESEDPAGSTAQGRPLGLLASWILHGGEFHSTKEHCDLFGVFMQDVGRRRTARDFLQKMPEGLKLCKYERPQRPGEPEEPEGWA